MAPYPTTSEIEQFSSSLQTSDPSPFFDRIDKNVQWTVMGTHVAAGHFTSLQDWKDNALGKANAFLSEPLKLNVINVVGGGEQEWAFLELEAHAKCKNGDPYEQRYAWALRFDQSGTVVQAKAYLDSALVQKCHEANQ